MVKFHLKALNAPRTWKIERKKKVFVARQNPGTHTKATSMPLLVVLRDFLKLAKLSKEVKFILTNNMILVNGKQRSDIRYPVGIMDLITIESLKKNYRVLLNKKGKLCFVDVPDSEKDTRMLKIVHKCTNNNKVQLGFHDGTTMLTSDRSLKTGDSVLYSHAEKKIIKQIKFEKGAYVYLTGGSHVGYTGIIDEISGNKIKVRIGKGVSETLRRFAFPMGKEKPLLTLL